MPFAGTGTTRTISGGTSLLSKVQANPFNPLQQQRGIQSNPVVANKPAPRTASATGGTGAVLGAATGGATAPLSNRSVGAADPQAAAQAQAEAANRARIASLRGDVSRVIGSIKQVFDQIYGDANAAAASQNVDLTKGYEATVGDINGELSQGLPKIGAAHSAAGTFDSSYRTNNEDSLRSDAESQIQAAGRDLESDKTKVGSWLASQQANVGAQKSGLDTVLSRIAESEDEAELAQLRNTLDERLTNVRASKADVQTNQSYLKTLSSATPGSQRVAAVQGTLAKIIGGSAAPALKKQVAGAFIANSGLEESEKQQLIQQVNAQIGTTETVRA